MQLGLIDRTALVLGASSGIGLACAEALREEGANVVMLARREELLKSQARRLAAHWIVGDLTQENAPARAVEETVRFHGGLDIVVLNGGGPPPGLANDVDGHVLDAAIDLLLRPAVRLVNAALPYLRASTQGRIISISSTSVREPIRNLALSNAVRPGVWGYLKTLADEVASDGITVNSVAPGRIATARMAELFGPEPPEAELAAIPAGRFGSPRELGDVVCFLASERASYINGALIRVDGGLSRSL